LPEQIIDNFGRFDEQRYHLALTVRINAQIGRQCKTGIDLGSGSWVGASAPQPASWAIARHATTAANVILKFNYAPAQELGLELSHRPAA
jgi:hypothetical protein